FEQNAGDLLARHEDVVRPLEPRLHFRDAPERLGGGDRGGQREGRQERLWQARADDDRGEQAGAGRRAPAAPATAAALQLLVGDPAGALAAPAPGQREGDGLRRADGVEADDAARRATARRHRTTKGLRRAWRARLPARRAAPAPWPRSRP